MSYTEIKERNGKRYYYRVVSVRKGKKISKVRKYLGVDLNEKERSLKEDEADDEFNLAIKDKKMRALEILKPKIIKILKKYGIKKAGIFGSYVRGEAKNKSDIDILVEPPKGIGFGFVGIQFELEDELKIKVDLVSYNWLSPYLKERILKEEVKII
jgi:predicted nucleotidyltransferase